MKTRRGLLPQAWANLSQWRIQGSSAMELLMGFSCGATWAAFYFAPMAAPLHPGYASDHTCNLRQPEINHLIQASNLIQSFLTYFLSFVTFSLFTICFYFYLIYLVIFFYLILYVKFNWR